MHAKGVAQCLGQSKCPINIHHGADNNGLPPIKKTPWMVWVFSVVNFNSIIRKGSISHFPSIFTYGKESEVPQMARAGADQKFALPPCPPLLPATAPSCLACLLVPRYAALCLIINHHSLCQSYSVIFSAVLPLAFPSRVESSLFFTNFCPMEKKSSPTPSEWEDEWSARCSSSNEPLVLFSSLSGHTWEGWGERCGGLPRDSRVASSPSASETGGSESDRKE